MKEWYGGCWDHQRTWRSTEGHGARPPHRILGPTFRSGRISGRWTLAVRCGYPSITGERSCTFDRRVDFVVEDRMVEIKAKAALESRVPTGRSGCRRGRLRWWVLWGWAFWVRVGALFGADGQSYGVALRTGAGGRQERLSLGVGVQRRVFLGWTMRRSSIRCWWGGAPPSEFLRPYGLTGRGWCPIFDLREGKGITQQVPE